MDGSLDGKGGTMDGGLDDEGRGTMDGDLVDKGGTMDGSLDDEGGTVDGSVVEGIGEGDGSTKALLIAIWSEDLSVTNAFPPVIYTKRGEVTVILAGETNEPGTLSLPK